MRKFYTWVPDYNPFDGHNRNSPSDTIFLKYPHLEGLITLEEFAVPEDNVKEFAPGKKWSYRLGYFEADDSTLSVFGTSVNDIVNKAKIVYGYHDIQDITDAEALEWVRKWSDLEEVEPGKFLIYPATGENIPAKYLEIA